MSTPVYSIDFETHLISKEQIVPKPVCLSWYDGTNKGLLVGYEEMSEWLEQAFKDRSTFIAQNATFELSVITRYFHNVTSNIWPCLEQGRFLCTKLAEQLLNNVREPKDQGGLSLDKLVMRYLKEDISADKTDPDAWRLRYSELEGVPKSEWPQKAIDYAIMDSVYAYKIWKLQRAQAWQTYPKIVSWNTKCEFTLNAIGQTGMEVDEGRVDTLIEEIQNHLAPQYTFLISKGMMEKKGNKYKKKITRLREHIQKTIEVPNRTLKGGVATDGEALSKYISDKPDDKILQAFKNISAYEKALSAYAKRLKEADPYIYTRYNAVVSSGRTSARTDKNYPSVNIQQMPRGLEGVTYDIRNCLKARDGYKIFAIDYNNLELIATAHQLKNQYGSSTMCDVINSGNGPKDMHSVLAARLMSIKQKRHVTYEEFVSKKKEPAYKEMRQTAKPVNLGFPGGIGYDTMRTLMARDGLYPKYKEYLRSTDYMEIKKAYYTVRDLPGIRLKRVSKTEYAIVYDELVELKQELFKLYPDLGKFLRNTHEFYQNGETKWKKNEFNEWEEEELYRFDFNGTKRDHCTYTSFCNGWLMQTPSAVGAKEVVAQAYRHFRDNDDVHLLAFIHDEIVCEIKDNESKYTHCEQLSKIMLDVMQKTLYNCRIAVEAEEMQYWAKAGTGWSKVYYKDVGDSEIKAA